MIGTGLDRSDTFPIITVTIIVFNIALISNKFSMVSLVYFHTCVLTVSVAQFISWFHKDCFQVSFINILSHKVVPYINMLCISCSTVAFTHKDCTHIINSYHDRQLYQNIHCQKYPSNELDILCLLYHSASELEALPLCFRAREREIAFCAFKIQATYKTSIQEYCNPHHASTSLWITTPVWVTVYDHIPLSFTFIGCIFKPKFFIDNMNLTTYFNSFIASEVTSFILFVNSLTAFAISGLKYFTRYRSIPTPVRYNFCSSSVNLPISLVSLTIWWWGVPGIL